MPDYKIIDKCLLCGNDTKRVFSLGETPLANEFVDDQTKKQDMFPLNLIQCVTCNHVQIDCIVDQDRLYRNYSYVSGTSPVNVKHFEEYAAKIMFNYLDTITFKDGDYLSALGKKINKMVLD